MRESGGRAGARERERDHIRTRSTRPTCASAPAEARATTASGRRASSDGELQRRRRREERRAAVDAAIERQCLSPSFASRLFKYRSARARAQEREHAAW